MGTTLRLLLIEDNAQHRALMQEELRRELAAEVTTVTTGEDGLAQLAGGTYDAVVMDFRLPDLDGLTVLRRIGERGIEVPVVIVTGMGDEQLAVRALKAGAYDYVVKGRGLDFARQLPAAVRDALKAFADSREHRRQLQQLREERETFAELSIRDDLTELFNRRHLSQVLPAEFSRARRYHQPLTAMMADIDGLKALNSLYGHAGGSAAIRHVATVIAATVRISDSCFRYGGDEFVLLLPSTQEKGALTLAHRLCERVAALPFSFAGKTLPVTVSIGTATYADGNYASGEELVRAADEALFRAKAAGRNTVLAAHAEAPASTAVASKEQPQAEASAPSAPRPTGATPGDVMQQSQGT
jgi:two-component system cell cycle response regulator